MEPEFTKEECALFRHEYFPKVERVSVFCHARNPSDLFSESCPPRKLASRDYYETVAQGTRRYRLHLVLDENRAVSDYVLCYLGIKPEWNKQEGFRGEQHLVHWAYTSNSVFHEDRDYMTGFKSNGEVHDTPDYINGRLPEFKPISAFIRLFTRMGPLSYENAWLSAIANTASSEHKISSSRTDEDSLFNEYDPQGIRDFNAFVEWLLELNSDSSAYLSSWQYIMDETVEAQQLFKKDQLKPEDERIFTEYDHFDECATNSRQIMEVLNDMDEDCMLGVQLNIYNRKLRLCDTWLLYPFLLIHRAGLMIDTRRLIQRIKPYILRPNGREMELDQEYTCMSLLRMMAPRKARDSLENLVGVVNDIPPLMDLTGDAEAPPSPPRTRQRKS